MQIRAGITIAEILAVLVLAGVMIAFVGLQGRSRIVDIARLSSNIVANAKSGSVLSGQAVEVGGGACRTISRVGEFSLETVVATWPPRGLLFTPDGLPRTCDGGGVGNTTILLEHRGRQAAVIVSSLGRVRWELR